MLVWRCPLEVSHEVLRSCTPLTAYSTCINLLPHPTPPLLLHVFSIVVRSIVPGIFVLGGVDKIGCPCLSYFLSKSVLDRLSRQHLLRRFLRQYLTESKKSEDRMKDTEDFLTNKKLFVREAKMLSVEDFFWSCSKYPSPSLSSIICQMSSLTSKKKNPSYATVYELIHSDVLKKLP